MRNSTVDIRRHLRRARTYPGWLPLFHLDHIYYDPALEIKHLRQITFRLLAPQAENVRLTGSDIPGAGSGKPMTKGANGIWEFTIGPIASGSYRYNFNVNGVAVIDPRSREAPPRRRLTSSFRIS